VPKQSDRTKIDLFYFSIYFTRCTLHLTLPEDVAGRTLRNCGRAQLRRCEGASYPKLHGSGPHQHHPASPSRSSCQSHKCRCSSGLSVCWFSSHSHTQRAPHMAHKRELCQSFGLASPHHTKGISRLRPAGYSPPNLSKYHWCVTIARVPMPSQLKAEKASGARERQTKP